MGDGYVHRLIHNKGDGKMVEVADPSTRSDQRPQTAPLSDTADEELVGRKRYGTIWHASTPAWSTNVCLVGHY